jgi:uncharacterized protein YmfQ (DUF2313 family)
MTVAERIPAVASEWRRLLPRGVAWAFPTDGVADRLLHALSLPAAYVEELAARCLDEADPRTTVEWLPDFERVYGLPDCTTTASSLVARRAAVVSKMNAPIGQTAAALITVAAAFGLECTIESYPLAVIDEAEIGDELFDEPWVHTIGVHLPNPPVVFFEADWSGAGDALAEDVTEAIECAINRVAPAHAVLWFQYDLPRADGYQPWDPWEAAAERAVVETGAPAPELEES